MIIDLKGKIAIVTGAARGIGASIASELVGSGCIVAIGDIDTGAAQTTASQLGDRALGMHLDVRDSDSVDSAVRRTIETYGRIDLLVNNAGILSSAKLQEMSEDELRRILDVNVMGVFRCVRAALPGMTGASGAAIINISSISAAKGGGIFGNVWYGATKAAVIAITKGLARELGPLGIRVNAIAPGVVESDMIRDRLTPAVRQNLLKRVPLGRMISALDIARCAVFLASAHAESLTGETITIDGGLLQT